MFGHRTLRCSFCRRRDAEVEKLVAGPGVYICDRCVAIAADIMEKDSGGEAPAQHGRLSLLRRIISRRRNPPGRQSFCITPSQ